MLAFINSRSLWGDEATSVLIASQPYAKMMQTLRQVDAVHALYYSLLHFWLHFGHAAIVIRSLSVLFALGASIAIGSIALLMFGENCALGAIAVLATSQFFLFFADEARSITLSVMTCSLLALSFWRVVKLQRGRDIVVCSLFAVIAVYTNFIALLFIAGLAASLGLMRLKRNTIILLIGTSAAACLAIVPLVLLIRENSVRQVGWIARGKPTQIFHIVSGILGGSFGTGSVSHVSGLLAVVCVSALMIVGFIGGWRSSDTRANVIAVSLWFVVPLALGVAVDHFIQPILIERYFSFTLIPVALLAGNGLLTIQRVSRPLVAYAIVGVLGVISIHGLLTVQREDWRSVSRLLTQNASPADGILFWQPAGIVPFEFAAGETLGLPAAAVVYPSASAVNSTFYPDPRPGFARSVSRKFKKLWLIESYGYKAEGDASPFDSLSRYYAHTHRQTFSEIQVVTFDR